MKHRPAQIVVTLLSGLLVFVTAWADEPSAVAPIEPVPAAVAPDAAPPAVALPPPAAVAPADAGSAETPVMIETPGDSDTKFKEYRERYASRNWRIGSLGGPRWSLGVHRRIGRHSGLGLNGYSVYPRRWEESGYDAGGISIAWWRERPNRLIPAVVGWSVAAGPMLAEYTAVRGDAQFPIASALGGAGSMSAYVILPLFNLLLDVSPRGWIPHLTLEFTLYGGIAGRFRNDGDTDLDGDGVMDYLDGQPFVDPDGKTIRRMYVYGSEGTGGLIWIF